ncbi:MAG: nucleotidyl transferase AbiEii/AbiGii toxin family protein [Candidatus Pacebacteria bacterium]|nr:nucleotidyl transferase AbiEii/AbiGii toxin family protein [Candidatus Paceibacterota bacterium]
MQIEVLKSKQKEIFPALNQFKEFYLVGGTALALQMGHRISVDFDLFTKKKLPSGLFEKAKRIFLGFKVSTSLKLPNQLAIKVNDVKIDFVHDEFGLLLKPIEFKKLKIAQIPEIAAMKAYALNFRGSTKDYFDLYSILKEKRASLQEIENIARRKYKNEFNFRLFLEQLLYLEGLRNDEVEFLKPEPSKEQMKKFFEQEISKIKL